MRAIPAFLVLVSSLGWLGGCRPSDERSGDPRGPDRSGLQELAERMAGSFSSAEQASLDSTFSDIRLHMVPIWPDAQGAIWFYVEQAEAGAQDQPYRQRVYRLTAEDDGGFRSSIYSLPGDPLTYAGAWREDDPLGDLAPGDLIPREGCDVRLRQNQHGDFVGGTVMGACPSSLRGATYATTEVEVFPETLVSWDRGFDEHGVQVWGSTVGGYVFRKEGT